MPDSLAARNLIEEVRNRSGGDSADVLAFPFGLHDVGNGKRFARDWIGEALYCFAETCWFIYEGGRWIKDATGAVQRMAKQTAAGIRDEPVGPNGDGAKLAQHCQASLGSTPIGKMLLMAASEPGMFVTLEEFDRDPYLLNVLNGTLELRIADCELRIEGDPNDDQLFVFRKHRREDMLLHQAPVVYDPEASPIEVLGFLTRIMPAFEGSPGQRCKDSGEYYCVECQETQNTKSEAALALADDNISGETILSRELTFDVDVRNPGAVGVLPGSGSENSTKEALPEMPLPALLSTSKIKISKDQEFPLCSTADHIATWQCDEMLDFLQRWAGLFLTGDVSDEAFLFCKGSGANGKGTFFEIFQKMLGPELSHSLPVNYFIDSKLTATQIPIHIQAARGKRLTIVAELPGRTKLDASTIKRWTGGDLRVGKGMRENLSTSSPTDKLVFYGNYEPELNDPSDGMKRRFKMLPFRVRLADEMDVTLKPRLKSPANLSALLNWALEGLGKWHVRRLTTPAMITEVSSAMLSQQDQLANFVKETFTLETEARSESKQVYEAYKRWCEENGEGRPITSRKFVRAMEEQGFSQTRNNKHWLGLSLVASFGHGPSDADAHEKSQKAMAENPEMWNK